VSQMKKIYSGKVRDIYEVDVEHLLLVASDRLSAFDVVMCEPVPDKGRVLTAMSKFWFGELADVAPNHLVSTAFVDLPKPARNEAFAGRSMLCRKAEMLPIECIARGYLAGSGLKEYRQYTTIHGEPAPPGLLEGSVLPEPRFTPSTKAAAGHDENIPFAKAVALVGREVAERARAITLAAYQRAADWAAARGIIIADTKLELGFVDGELSICDELITPDSSRFWPAAGHAPGRTPASFDKQPVRDYLDSLDWNKQPPPPRLPDSIVRATRDRYIEAYERISGLRFADWNG